MSEKIYECVICGARKPGDEVSFWWGAQPAGRHQVDAYPMGFACDGACAGPMEERVMLWGDGRPVACSLQASAMQHTAHEDRLLGAYAWSDGGAAVKRWAKRYKRDGVDEDSIGYKRQSLVRWLMARPRCVPLERAKLIAARKYPR